jgi:hypothetical protein
MEEGVGAGRDYCHAVPGTENCPEGFWPQGFFFGPQVGKAENEGQGVTHDAMG